MKTYNLNRLNIKRIVIAVAVSICVVFISCTQDKLESGVVTQVGQNVELRFKAFATNVEPEATVNRVRVVIFGSYQSADRGQCIYNQVATPNTEGSIARILISAGLRDIYLIVNEPTGAKAQYDAINTIGELNAMKVPYKGGVTAETVLEEGLPMFCSYINQMVVGENNIFGAGVEYLLAKVSVNIVFTEGGITENPNVGDVEVTSMKIYNIPQYGTLAPSIYNSNDYHTAALTHATTVSDKTTTYSTEFYLPEHIVKSADSKTFVEVRGKNKNTNETSTWIVKLGDATVTTPMPAPARTPYNITRNMHYTVDATIRSYGEVDVNLKVEIAPWKMVNIDSPAGEHIICNTEEVMLTHNTNNISTKVAVNFFANKMGQVVISSKNNRVDVDKTDVINGNLIFSINSEIDLHSINDYSNFDEVSLIIDDYVYTIKVSYQPPIEMVDWDPKDVQVPWSGGKGTVWCETTVGEWYLILKDNNGNVYAKSAKTDIVADGVKIRQERTIQLPVNVNGAPIDYVIEVHQERLLPENIFSPKHFFRNTQMAGYKLTLTADGTSSLTPAISGGEGALLSSIGPDNKYHDLFFKYGSLYGIESYVVNGERKSPNDTWSSNDIVWYPVAPAAIPTTWGGITGLTGAFNTPTFENVKALQGDPCRLVGLTTFEIATGKIDNGVWRMGNKTELTGFFKPLVASEYVFPMDMGGVVTALGYRNAAGTIVQQSFTYGGPYAHALISVYDQSVSHIAAWFNQNTPGWNHSTMASGGLNHLGYNSTVGMPSTNNGMSVRCIRYNR